MPLGDFSVEGLIDARDNLSEKAQDIAGSLYGAADAADEAGDQVSGAVDDFTALAGAAETLDFSVNQAEEEFEELNDEVQEGLANLQAMQGQMVATGGSAQVLRSSLEGIDADQIVESESFRTSLLDFFEDEGQDRSAIGGALGNFSRTDDSTLGDLVERIRGRGDTDVSTEVATRGVAEAATELGAYSAAARGAASAADDAEDETDELTVASIGLSGALGVTNSALSSFVIGLLSTEQSLDEVEDEVDSLTRSLAQLGPALSTISANIGPFNVALSNVLVTLPAIFATVGPLIAVLGALAAAFGAVALAMGAILGVGLLLFVEELQQNFAGIENKMEAVEAIAKGLAMALREAIQPLTEATVGGMGPIEFLIEVLQGFVHWVRIASEILAELLEMEEVEEFMDRIGGALLGSSDAAQSTMGMMEALRVVVEKALPVLTDLLVYLIVNLPAAMAFMADITEDVSGALGDFSLSMMGFVTTLIELGVAVLNHVLPPLTFLIRVITQVIDVMMRAMDLLGPFGEALIALGMAATVAVVGLSKLNQTIFLFAQALAVFVESEAAARRMLQLATFHALKLVGALAILAAGLYLIESALNDMGVSLAIVLEPLIFLIDVISTITSAFFEMFVGVSDALGITEELSIVVRLLAGVLLTAIGLMATYAQLQTIWAAATASSIIPTAGLTTAVQYLNTTLLTTSGLLSMAGVLLFMMGAALAAGTLELEDFGAAGEAVQDILDSIAELLPVTGEELESVTGAVIALSGAMLVYTGSAKSAALWTGRLLKVLIILGAVLAGLELVSGSKDLEDFGAAGKWAKEQLRGLADAINNIPGVDVTAEGLEKMVGMLAAAAGIAKLLPSFFGTILTFISEGIIVGLAGMIAKLGPLFRILGGAFQLIIHGGRILMGVLAGISATTAAIIAIVAVAAGIFAHWALNMQETVDKFQRVFDILGRKIQETEGMVRFFWILLASLATLVIKPFQELFELILNPGETLSDWADWIMAGIDTVKDAIIGVWDWAAGGIMDFIDGLTQTVDRFIDLLEEALDTATGQGGSGIGSRTAKAAGINSLFKEGGGLPDVTFGHDIPFVAKGGFVESEGLAYVHSNEMVIPQDKMQQVAAGIDIGNLSNVPMGGTGGGTTRNEQTTVNVQVNAGSGQISDRERYRIGRIVRDYTRRERRRNTGN